MADRLVIVRVTDSDVTHLYVEEWDVLPHNDGAPVRYGTMPVPEDDTLQEDMREVIDVYAAEFASNQDELELVDRLRVRFHLDAKHVPTETCPECGREILPGIRVGNSQDHG